MSNDFYEASGTPAQRSQGASSPIRAEFSDIELGFNKLPLLTGNANRPVVVNAGATALTTVLALPPAQGGTGAGTFTAGSVVFAGVTGTYNQNNSNFFWDNTGIGLGIGSTSLTGYNLRISAPIGGVGSAVGVAVNGEVQTSAITSPASFASQPTFNAGVFAVGTYTHYSASQGAIGGATITNQYGFLAASNIASGTLVAGFRGDITSGTGKWNFYASGTAANAFAGSTRFGSVVAPTVMVDITGDLIASGQATIAATAPVSAIATTKLWITGDITLIQGNRGFLGNLYYDGAWKYTAGGSSGAALKVGLDTTTAFQFLVAPNNAGGAGAAASPTAAASITGAGVFNIAAAVITGATITNPTFTNPPTLTGFLSGSVLFAGASGVISRDNANFFWDDTNNRLGLGDATPSYLLHVVAPTAAGTVANTAFIGGTPSATAGNGARLYLSGASDGSRSAYIEGVNTTGSSQAHAIVFGTSDASATPVERMRVNNNGTLTVGLASATTNVLCFDPLTNCLAIGTPSVSAIYGLRIIQAFAAAATVFAARAELTATGALTTFYGYRTDIGVPTALVINTIRHFSANQDTIHASATITEQSGYYAHATLAAGTLVAGFNGALVTAAGRWNFYASGTANNAFLGATRFGSVVAPTTTVDITGTLTVSATANFNGNLAAAAHIAFGGTPISGTRLVVAPPSASGAVDVEGVHVVGDVPVQAMTTFSPFKSEVTLPNAAYTLTTMNHFEVDGPTKPATPGFVNQRGFLVNSNMVNATGQNVAFYGNIAAGALPPSNWNFYGAGGAPNAFVGKVRFGSVVAPTEAIDVTGNVLVSGNVGVTGDLGVGAAATIGWSTRANLTSPADASIILYNAAFTIGTRLSSTADGALSILTAAGGATGALSVGTVNSTANGVYVRSGTAVAAAVATQYLIKGATTSIGLFYGSGAPAFAAATGSLFLRSDGAANTRLYICTVAAGTWAAVTTP